MEEKFNKSLNNENRFYPAELNEGLPTIRKLIKEHICKCGHHLDEHVLGQKNIRYCMHNIVGEDGKLIFCDCENYKELK
jgi:hypothetical protein